MTPKEIALWLVTTAAAIFPPLNELLGAALAAAPEPRKALAEEVLAMLPAEGASAKVRRELEGNGP